MNSIDWAKVRDFLEALVIVWGFISGGLVLWLRGQFVTRKTFDATVRRLDEATEACRKAGSDEIMLLTIAIEKLNGTIGRLDERASAETRSAGRVAVQLDRIENFLLTGKAA